MTDKILLVDDEPNVLQSMQRQLHNRFALRTAGSGEEALRLLEEEGPFAVIVTDMRMPGMTGVELLARTKDLYPDMVRLMLTGHADQETAMEAVNSGQIFRFLTKPCPQATFVISLALALRQHRLIVAEKELLQKTLKGSIHVLSELLGVANPLAFSAGLRIRDYVVRIAQELHLPQIWQCEIAALMSQIGCITLPPDILNKVYAGAKMSAEESEMFNNHPLVGASLLEKIPRLEHVTKMICLQQKRYDAYTAELMKTIPEEVAVGAQILKAVIDYDRHLARGMSRGEAIGQLRKTTGVYHPAVLSLLTSLKLEDQRPVLSLAANQVGVGMVAMDDILTKSKVLIIPKGLTLTWAMVQGLQNFSKKVGVVEPIRVMLGQSEPDT
ncbi:response regulator receiver protein [Desulfobulbus propionicus DSM 2032]|jgi:response regulator RpfG family c-di-GMP phosphodiesterase|uniref:Response regulator receiver protein n=1 Tax=Desulfobulbus propionicus (strain ATCC 33891 / DSM 2032 / VKM B-1956 / 1pr3) TaxID=577650 RepID=A0A7U4DNX5_DESPD|nr:HD domain-containing phosphohydrolase [Desulfobulbus propionicus]ADW17467.1 response regulator receiver protein [Desulfobulbus propionicus DSM 2032]